MKRIISFLVIVAMMAACFIAVIPASAATKSFEVDWTALAYVAYNENGYQVDEFTFLDSFEVTKTDTTFGVNRIGAGVQSNSYISTSQFAITSETDYTFEIMAKNNNSLKYSGVPFAIDADGMVYFVYGSFNNKNDTDGAPSTNMSYVISAKGDFNKKYPNTLGEANEVYFKKLKLSSDGFASMKFEYKGLTVSVYVKDESGSYSHIGEDITLPEGSKLVFGVFSRDNHNNGNRTTTVKNAKITGNNDAAVKNMVIESNNGASDLKAEILRVEKEYPEVDYTKATYKEVKAALENAKAVAEDSFSTADEVTAAMDELTAAVENLEFAEVDTSELEDAIKEAEKLKKDKYTSISYNMVMEAVESAKELLDDADARQSKINAAAESILGRIEGLVLSNDATEDDEDASDEDAGDEENTDDNANDSTGQATGTQAPVAPAPAPNAKKGCKSAVTTTAVVLGVVAALGSALVIKKRD